MEIIFRVYLYCKIEGKRTFFIWWGKWEEFGDVPPDKKAILSPLMNSNMVNRKKFDHVHLVYYFTVPLIREYFLLKIFNNDEKQISYITTEEQLFQSPF